MKGSTFHPTTLCAPVRGDHGRPAMIVLVGRRTQEERPKQFRTGSERPHAALSAYVPQYRRIRIRTRRNLAHSLTLVSWEDDKRHNSSCCARKMIGYGAILCGQSRPPGGIHTEPFVGDSGNRAGEQVERSLKDSRSACIFALHVEYRAQRMCT